MFKKLYEKYIKSRVYLVTSLVLTVISIIILIIVYQSKISFSIYGTKFKYVSSSYNQILFKDSAGNKVTVTIDDSDNGFSPSAIAPKYQITYKNKLIKYNSTDWINKGQTITRTDGTQYTYIPPSSDSLPYLEFDTQLVTYINNIYYFVQNGHLFLRLFFIIPLIFLGLLLIVYPEEIWYLQKILYIKGGEPTEFALDMNKFGGAIIVIFALIVPFLQL